MLFDQFVKGKKALSVNICRKYESSSRGDVEEVTAKTRSRLNLPFPMRVYPCLLLHYMRAELGVLVYDISRLVISIKETCSPSDMESATSHVSRILRLR